MVSLIIPIPSIERGGMLATGGPRVKGEVRANTRLTGNAVLPDGRLAAMIGSARKEHGGSAMRRAKSPSSEESFFSLRQAKWVVGVLSMLIAVVGRDSLLGLILRQTRSEIKSIVQDEEPGPTPASCYQNN
jgi:hypothetical protein